MKNINDLRTALFETMQDVRKGEIDTKQAKAVVDIAQTIVNTAKVEVEFMQVTGLTDGTGFIAGPEEQSEIIDDASALPDGITRIVRHRIAG